MATHKNAPHHIKENATVKVKKCFDDPELDEEQKLECAIHELASQTDTNREELQKQITDLPMQELLVLTKTIYDTVQIHDGKLDQIDKRLNNIEDQMVTKEDLNQIDSRFDQMVTKEELHEEFEVFKENILQAIRKNNEEE